MLRFPAQWISKEIPSPPCLRLENGRDRKWHQRWIRQRGQFDEQAVTSESREQTAGNCLRKYGLPDTAGPRHGDHSIGRKQL